jgi:hypothetical protein
LNLEGNLLKLKSVQELFLSMSMKPAIISLNVSANNLGDVVCEDIKNFLMNCYTIKELYLRWNKIT